MAPCFIPLFLVVGFRVTNDTNQWHGIVGSNLAADIFVSPNGDDLRSGLDESNAVQTIARVRFLFVLCSAVFFWAATVLTLFPIFRPLVLLQITQISFLYLEHTTFHRHKQSHARLQSRRLQRRRMM